MLQFRFASFLFLLIYIPMTSCDAPSAPAANPLNEQPAATRSDSISVAPTAPLAAAPPPPPPPPDFLEASRFSPPHYNKMLQRLFPIDRELRKASGALLESVLNALEDDGPFFPWDHFSRNGAIVLLGTKNGNVIGLTQRYFTDIKYPSIKLLPDMIGYADIVSQYLTIYDNRDNCRKKRKAAARSSNLCRSHRFKVVKYRPEQEVKPDQVQAQTFEDHDITLLYFSTEAKIISERETMGIQHPVQLVEHHIRDASRWYGFEFTLVSKVAFHEMKAKIAAESWGEDLILSAATMAMGPMINQLTARLALPPDVREQIQEKVKELASKKVASVGVGMIDGLEGATTLAEDHQIEHLFTFYPTDVRTKARLSESSLTAEGCLSLRLSMIEGATACPLGIIAPEVGEQANALASYLAKTITSAEITLANFSEDHGKPLAMVLIPGEQVNLNYEILRHGLVKLDIGDARALKAFPELIEASQAALEAGTGFARDWKNDPEYVAQVQQAATF